MKTQTTIRVDEEAYKKAKKILDDIGLTYSQAINVFNKMIVLNKGIPFDVKLPTKETEIALNELAKKQGKTFKNTDDLFKDLDS
jgi:DNA-damage-inducible protein J